MLNVLEYYVMPTFSKERVNASLFMSALHLLSTSTN